MLRRTTQQRYTCRSIFLFDLPVSETAVRSEIMPRLPYYSRELSSYVVYTYNPERLTTCIMSNRTNTVTESAAYSVESCAHVHG